MQVSKVDSVGFRDEQNPKPLDVKIEKVHLQPYRAMDDESSDQSMSHASLDKQKHQSGQQQEGRGDGWTEAEETKLFELHNVYGNRWAKISHFLVGKYPSYVFRTDNCIKNHFYCTLRKAFRRINRYITENKAKAKCKQIKNAVLSKIISVAEQRFETKLDVSSQMIDSCFKIKNQLVKFSKEIPIDEATEASVLELINDINEFSKNFKKRKVKKPEKGTTEDEPVEPQPKRNPFASSIEGTNGHRIETSVTLPQKLELSKSLQFDIEEFNRNLTNPDAFDDLMLEPGSPPRIFDTTDPAIPKTTSSSSTKNKNHATEFDV